VADTHSLIPQNYAEWQHCITVDCGIALEAAYINTRIAVLTNPESEETTRFRRLYGDQHWQNIVRWFRQAQQAVAAA
jgi:hypothetical protein